MRFKFFFLLLLTALFAACSAGPMTTPTLAAPTTEVPTLSQPTADPASQPASLTPTIPAPARSSTSVPLDAADWKSWSVVPALSPEMLYIYKSGQALQRDPHVVSVVGDCESSSDWFLKDFSKDQRFYDLG